MTGEEFVGEMIRFFGWRRTAELLGCCVLWTISGKDPEEVKRAPARTTAWRVRRDLQKFRLEMIAEGKWTDEDEADTEEGLINRVAGLKPI